MAASRPRLTPRTPNSPEFSLASTTKAPAPAQRGPDPPAVTLVGLSAKSCARETQRSSGSEGGSSTRRVASTSPGPRSARPRARGAGNPTGTGTGTATRTISPWRTGRYAVSTARSIRRPEEAKEECAICLENFKFGQVLAVFGAGCRHTFHQACVVEWFRTGDVRCPLCRYEEKNDYHSNCF